MNYHQFYQILKKDPVYKLGDYSKDVSNGKVWNVDDPNSWHLTPLEDDDMKRYAASDVEEWMLKNGTNTTKLGNPMSDEEFRRWQGLE